MNKKQKISLMLIVLLTLNFMLISCDKTSIVGEWKLESVKNGKMEGEYRTIVFLEDGTGISNLGEDETIKSNLGNFKWKVDKNILTWIISNFEITEEYKVTGSTLTLTSESGVILIYKRIK